MIQQNNVVDAMFSGWLTSGELPPEVCFAIQHVGDEVFWDFSQGRAAEKWRFLGEFFPAQRSEGATAEAGRKQMIKNEKQYRITKAQARRFEEALAELARQQRPAEITRRLWQAQRDAAESQLQDLREKIEAYERLYTGKGKELVLETVEDLPKTLIRARIASGMTQEVLAHRLGVKTQQVQRYEATEYASASFDRIRKVVRALGLRMPKPARLVRDSAAIND